MNKLSLFALSLISTFSAATAQETSAEMQVFNILDNAVYYDGYQVEKIFDIDKEDGILRHSNDIYAIKLSDEFLSSLGDNLWMHLTLGALCDNYDRVGNVNIAFVPKGAKSYKYDDVDRCEISRYITPFMNKNKEPNQVPYDYDLSLVSLILRDPSIREKYDLWLESVVFGVPYAANTQISGCKDRNDVFSVSIDMATDTSPAEAAADHIFIPIYTKAPEVKGPVNLNNYREVATDTLKKTTRSFTFTLPEDVEDAVITIISTPHGANQGGEEYVRRKHLVYFDGDIVLSFKPGGESCEPYRQYNTQSNGIYGYKVMTPAEWTSWNNWCPGQAVPIRYIPLGAVKAGTHTVMIRVPQAKFIGGEGDIRPSLYFQGMRHGKVQSGITDVVAKGPEVKFTRRGDIITFETESFIRELTIHTFDGTPVYGRFNPGNSIDISALTPGAYILSLFAPDGSASVCKIIK